VESEPISRLAQLKHALGRLYAGDRVEIEVRRDGAQIVTTAELVDKLVPYRHPFLGLLPSRSEGEEGVGVRYVYEGSAAADAAIKPGDRIVQVSGENTATLEDLMLLLARRQPGEEISLQVKRDGETLSLDNIKLEEMPADVPMFLPPARAPSQPPADRPELGKVEVKIPEQPNNCWAYVPENYDPGAKYGVLVWLHGNTGYNIDELTEAWRDLCAAHDFILLAPQAGSETGWRPTELEYLRKALDQLSVSYSTDPHRIVVAGQQIGGAMAYLLAFAERDVVRGVAVVDAALPTRVQVPDNEPLRRLFVFTTLAEKSRIASGVEQGVEQLRELGFPVTVFRSGSSSTIWNAEKRDELARWLDTLDRL
jgi:serine protease Do